VPARHPADAPYRIRDAIDWIAAGDPAPRKDRNKGLAR